MRTKLYAGVAFAALMIPASAFAQSTGSTDVEEIVVTGDSGPRDTNGIQIPEAPKARAIITQELIERRVPGQTVFDTINLIPSVSFTNADPYGASGGNIRIRGFDGARISATFDGLPTNDSGNYALYTNQILDPELIEQVNVNFGSADVDSPTASAAGGTVNYRSINPRDEMGFAAGFSRGTNDMTRAFGIFHTGEFTSFGTKAWIAGSTQRYEQFRGPGELQRYQVNGKIYQPLGGNNFVSVSGHYNRNRNNFYSNPSLANLRTVLTSAVIPATGIPANPIVVGLSDSQYDTVFDDTSSAFRYVRSCTLPSALQAGFGVQDDRTQAACGNLMTTAINPSNTGNIRMNSRFELSDRLTLTVDAGYQYTKATGGGSTILSELDANAVGQGLPSSATGSLINYQGGRLGAGIAPGVDINRDGDLNDFVRIYTPSITRTNRLTSIVGLRYDLDDNNLVRVAYTWDRARHRQTGEGSLLQGTGQVNNPFGAVYGESYQVKDAAGNPLQKRNRLSYAILHQISGEYRGNFLDDALNVTVGVRAPFFRRNLNNYCYTIRSNSSEGYCTSQTDAQVAATDAANASFVLAAPYQHRIKTYSAVLPNVGATFNFTPAISAFASYAKGFSAPRTDNLYGFDDVTFVPTTDVTPEKTDSFDLGLRYTTGLIQAQLAGWIIKYNNRIISTTIELEGGAGTINADRNVGRVDTKGVDFSLGVTPVRGVSLYGFVSYTDSELKEDAGGLATAGKFVVETPEWQYGGRAQVSFDPVSIGAQVKRTGDRFVTDVNDIVSKGYTVVDLDARLSLGFAGFERTYLQLNVTNLLDEKYFGNLTTASSVTQGTPRFTFGAPRTVIGSIHFEF